MSSMKFGLILMILICALSLIGSFLPQGQPMSYYAQANPGTAAIIVALGLDRMFSVWYFVALLGLLCANLTLCSIIRIRRVVSAHGLALEKAESTAPTEALSSAQRDVLTAYLKDKGFKLRQSGAVSVFHKNALGHYGSFLVHISFLLILIVGALVIYISDTADYVVFPNQSINLEDGTNLNLLSFRIADDSGRLDFSSLIDIAAPNGERSGPREISVNYPLSYKGYKYYQQSYATAGSVTATNRQTGGSDDFMLTEPSFLSADGRDGIWYETLYPGYVRDEDGHFTLITSTSGVYIDPVYQVHVMSGGDMTPVLAFPGETIEIGALSFTFNAPVEYPGIRVKHTPAALLSLLYAVFVIMTLGFWLCFFHVPAVVAVHDGGYAVCGQKTSGIRLQIDILLESGKGETHL